jgi:hypothetical protein
MVRALGLKSPQDPKPTAQFWDAVIADIQLRTHVVQDHGKPEFSERPRRLLRPI